MKKHLTVKNYFLSVPFWSFNSNYTNLVALVNFTQSHNCNRSFV